MVRFQVTMQIINEYDDVETWEKVGTIIESSIERAMVVVDELLNLPMSVGWQRDIQQADGKQTYRKEFGLSEKRVRYCVYEKIFDRDVPILDTLLWCKIAANSQVAKSIWLDTHNGLLDSQEKICDNTMLSASRQSAQDMGDREIQPVWWDILTFKNTNLKPLVKRIK